MLKVRLLRAKTLLNYQSVLSLWQHNEIFRTFYIELLASVDYIAYRWETPPLNLKTACQPFECVLINSPELAVPADASAFRSYFDDSLSPHPVVLFPNLSGDAWLVVPRPKTNHDAYSHLAAFSRQAPVYQNHALWKQVGRFVSQRLNHTPKWLNTAGGGVAWLHIRLDNNPKYYHHTPYRRI